MSMRTEQPINRQQVIDAALAIVDEQGSEALTMRAVGKRVDRHVSSLYNHVANRSELVELLSAHVAQTIDVSSFGVGPWDVALTGWARSYVGAFLDHPNLVAILAFSPVRDLPTLENYERIFGALTAEGWDALDAAVVVRTVEAFTWGSIIDITASPVQLEPGELPEGLSTTRTILESAEQDPVSGQTAFEVGLAALMDGLRARYGRAT
jgi:AcrR family transcriptional regulator